MPAAILTVAVERSGRRSVLVTRGPTGIVYTPPLWVDCSFATELASIERVVQDEEGEQLHTSIRRIDTLGAYVRVTRAGRSPRATRPSPPSASISFGLAFDLRSLTPARRREITVLKDYERGTDAPAQPRAIFLHNVAVHLKRETGLTHVLTPDFDADPANHFHLDRSLPFGWWWRIDDPSGERPLPEVITWRPEPHAARFLMQARSAIHC